MSKSVDHSATAPRGVESDTAEGSEVRAAHAKKNNGKIGTPLRVQNDFEWIYTGKQLYKCVIATGNHPAASALADQYHDLDAEQFAVVRAAADDSAGQLFDAALAMFLSERAEDRNWFMKPLWNTINDLTLQVQQAYDASAKNHKLGLLKGEALDILNRKVERYDAALYGDSEDDWFSMKNNAQALVNQGFQETAAGIRRAISAGDWLSRAEKQDNEQHIASATNMLEGGRHQKLLGIVQILAVGDVFNKLITDEHAYPLRFNAENGARECLRFEAWQNAQKFAHPGAVDGRETATAATNDLLLNEAIGGI